MSFSIDSLLKRDDIRGKEKIRSETSSRMRRHFHYDLDDMGGVIAYRGESLTMKDHRHIKSKDVEFTRTGITSSFNVEHENILFCHSPGFLG